MAARKKKSKKKRRPDPPRRAKPPAAPVPAAPPAPVPAAAARALPAADAPLFSILMPTYNRSGYVGDAMRSALDQPYRRLELVVVDDGSTDDTATVVRAIAARDDRVRYVQKPLNEGRSRTRNVCLEHARGDYVLWLADDDLLDPRTLELYADAVRHHPETDVVYGNLQLFDDATGELLNVFEPNDWTGAGARLLGGFLVGSCIPDGGSLIRRALYERYGTYDPEFVRAQDYEFWSRAAEDLRVRKIDEIVYQYRKHGGNVSFGGVIDLSYDSKIIRRLLARHPLPRLFPALDWTEPTWSTAVAWWRVARNLFIYEDFYNARRFLEAIPEPFGWDEVVEDTVKALVGQGDLDAADAFVVRFAEAQARPHRLAGDLRRRLAAFRAARDAARAAALADDVPALQRAAQALHALFAPAVDATIAWAELHCRAGSAETAAGLYKQAVRLAPTDAALGERAAPIIAAQDARFEIARTRARLLEPLFDVQPPPAEDLPASGPTVSVIVLDIGDPDALQRALASVDRQRYRDLEVHVVVDPDEGLSRATGSYVAWLRPPDVWLPRHVSALVARLERDHAEVAFAEARRVTLAGDEVTARATLDAPVFDVGALLARPILPLSAVLHARDAAEPFDASLAHAAWDFLLCLTEDRRPAHVLTPGLEVQDEPPDDPNDPAARRALQAVYQRHARAALFNTRARALQAQRLEPFGVRPARRGTSSVVVLADPDPETTRRTVEQILAHTLVPAEVVLVADAPSEALRETLRALRDTHDAVRSEATRRPAGRAKVLNRGLSNANGDYVALLAGDARVPQGWLGRLQWWLAQTPGTGFVEPVFGAAPDAAVTHRDESAPATHFDLRCVVLDRAVLDRVGGFDVALTGSGLEDVDFGLRARIAGFAGLVAADVCVDAGPPPDAAAAPHRARFERKWGAPGPTDGRLPAPGGAIYDRDRHALPFGAERGYRPEAEPVMVEEAAAHNVLVLPPWQDDAALAALLRDLAAAPPADCAFWLRSAPDAGAACTRRLDRLARAAGLDPAALPAVLVIDAALAPEREAGLYTACDRVYLDPRWPQADVVFLRAIDCATELLEGADALAAWLGAGKGRSNR